MAHSYNIDSFRCGCEFCAPVPAADRKFEPAQDPRLWHRPVANGRHPLVLDRCFTFEKQNAFICRHVHAPWINCYSFKPPEGYDSDADDPDDKDNPVMSLSDFSGGTSSSRASSSSRAGRLARRPRSTRRSFRGSSTGRRSRTSASRRSCPTWARWSRAARGARLPRAPTGSGATCSPE